MCVNYYYERSLIELIILCVCCLAVIDGCSCLSGQESGCIGLCSTFSSRYDVKRAINLEYDAVTISTQN